VALSALSDLMPGGSAPQVWLVPKGGNLGWWIAPAGITTLARRSGYYIQAVPVHVDDPVVIRFGEVEDHTSTAWPTAIEEIAGVFVTIRRISDGAILARPWLARTAINQRRAVALDQNIWNKWPIEMAQKTALHWAYNRGSMPIDEAEGRLAMETEGKILDAAKILDAQPMPTRTQAPRIEDFNADSVFDGYAPVREKVSVANTNESTEDQGGAV
jgi:recombinational DNA repair protein RecT